jgi:hypothetical protein
MSSQLEIAGGDGPQRCSFCSNEAAGPCASCERPVCGDCCTLTEGGVRTWAICLECDRKKGRSLTSAWGSFGLFLVGILVLLAAAVAALAWCSSPR